MNLPTDHVLFGAFSVVLILAAIQDVRFQKIPNLLTFPSIVIAVGCHGVSDGWGGLWFSLAGFGVGMGLMIIPYSFGVMGAGDVKLMGAAGAVLGVRGVFVAFLITSVAGTLYVLAYAVLHQKWGREFLVRVFTMLKLSVLSQQLVRVGPAGQETQFKKPRLCYGVAIAVGVSWTMVSLVWCRRLPVLPYWG